MHSNLECMTAKFQVFCSRRRYLANTTSVMATTSRFLRGSTHEEGEDFRALSLMDVRHLVIGAQIKLVLHDGIDLGDRRAHSRKTLTYSVKRKECLALC